MRRRHDLVSPSCCLSGLVLLLTLSARAQRQAETDPAEVAALNAIFSAWSMRASPEWNISGEPCSGAAIDDTTDIDNDPNFNPAIKCDCSYNASTVCHITKLKVYALDVNGQILAELQNLTYLTNLNLAQNYLTGSLPAFIEKLTRLQYLALGINALTGVLPTELGNLKNLVSLSISTNKFIGPLPEVVENLTKLEQLYIDSCGLSGELPSTFSKLKNLRVLWASDNDFTGRIPDYIGSLSNLSHLRLQGNNFDGPIPASFSNLVNLINLRIGDLTGEVSSLAFVVNMTSLNTLVLRNSRISDNLASVDFSKFVELTYLDLSFNSITGEVSPILHNLSSLNFLYLGSNNLSGSLPDRSPSVSTMFIDLSYNMLSGRLPPWVNMNNLHVNLVWNNFVMDSSNNSMLPSGLNCLQRDTPCLIDSSFAVDSGGKALIKASDNSIYEPDDASLVGAAYYVSNSTRWGVSNIGTFMDSPRDESYIINSSSHPLTNTRDPALFQTARMSPSSLRYYGIGLKNGAYNVVLEFAEIFFPDDQTWTSVGKRIFDIYIQGENVEKDFDIKTQTNGKSYSVVKKQYNAEVTNNFIEIHLFWAGKGTCCIPSQGMYGPLISALSVSSYGSNNEVDLGHQKKSIGRSKTGLVVGVVSCVTVLGFLALTGTYVWRQKRRTEMEMEELFSIVGRPNIFSYGEIKSATDSFSPANILGRGGYGLVYKGKLHDGSMVAVKQLSPTSHQGKKEFMTEVATISAVQHRNLVKLHGCCMDSKAPLLVYEYLENGSLDRAIFGKTELNLDWRTRFEICVGIARGLAYLHEESSMRIVHRDIKASNVLLDADLNPKISDFGAG